ncbi:MULTISPECIES: aldo/keto reductase [unclassified Roseitalea]|uniref:aldo/keto reductase n=1 Tax=unclassified Roseitalea TaxID=2639107 RepID=UPI00273DEEC2|nr:MULTISPECIES: aldo/keto reductase [unclassified Roseitalea]
MPQEATKQAHLPTRALGANGPLVSQLALGTMTFGAETGETEAFGQLDLFVERGGTLIDTADVYGAGASEAIIGRWSRQRGGMDDLIVATKARFAPPAGSRGGSRRAIRRCLDASLNRLQVDAVDLYFIHGWDRHTQIEETLATLGDLVAAGRIHNIGWSNLTGWQLQKIVSAARAGGYPLPVAVQPQYNLLERGVEIEVLPCCLDEAIALTPWSPLGGGWLTGKYGAQARPTGATRLGEDPDRGVEAYDRRNTERTYAILDVVRAVAERYGRPPAHVAIAWLLARPGVATVLLGARTVAQLADNLAAADLVLEAADLQALTEASAPGLPSYPYAFVQDWSGLEVWKTLGT